MGIQEQNQLIEKLKSGELDPVSKDGLTALRTLLRSNSPQKLVDLQALPQEMVGKIEGLLNISKREFDLFRPEEIDDTTVADPFGDYEPQDLKLKPEPEPEIYYDPMADIRRGPRPR